MYGNSVMMVAMCERMKLQYMYMNYVYKHPFLVLYYTQIT